MSNNIIQMLGNNQLLLILLDIPYWSTDKKQ